MTDLLTAEGATPTARSRLRENRGLIIIVVVVLLGAVVMALAQSRRASGAFDPEAFDRSGSHAAAQLLRDQGVDIVRVTRAADAQAAVLAHQGDVTLVIMPTAPLSQRMAELLSTAPVTHLVLVSPDDTTLVTMAPWAEPVSGSSSTDEIDAGCTWPTAARVGTLPREGVTYHANRDGAQRCWSGLVLDDSTDVSRTTTIVGAPQAYTNDALATSGYAALSLDTLGRSHTGRSSRSRSRCSWSCGGAGGAWAGSSSSRCPWSCAPPRRSRVARGSTAAAGPGVGPPTRCARRPPRGCGRASRCPPPPTSRRSRRP
jgi:hypothetical protein